MNGEHGDANQRKVHTAGVTVGGRFQKVSVCQHWAGKDTWVSKRPATSSRNFQGSWIGRDLVNGALCEAFTASAEQRALYHHYIS